MCQKLVQRQLKAYWSSGFSTEPKPPEGQTQYSHLHPLRYKQYFLGFGTLPCKDPVQLQINYRGKIFLFLTKNTKLVKTDVLDTNCRISFSKNLHLDY